MVSIGRSIRLGMLVATLGLTPALAENGVAHAAGNAQQGNHQQTDAKPARTTPASRQKEQTAASTGERERHAADQKKKRREEFTFWAGMAQAMAAILGVFGLGFTVWYAHRAWKEAQSAATAAHKMLEHSERVAVMQLRPYITVTAVSFKDMRDRTQRRAVVSKKNTGATPAVNVRTWIGVEIAPYPYAGEFKLPPKHLRLGSDVMPPNVPHTATQPFRRLRRSVRLDAEAGKRAFYVFGSIRYEDILGNEYETRYRFVCTGSRVNTGIVQADEIGNEMIDHGRKGDLAKTA